MAEFRETVLSWNLLVPALSNVYFWVVGLSALYNAFSSNESAPTPSRPHNCSPEKVWGKMDTSVRWMATLMVASLLLMYYVRKLVETVAAIELKHGKEEIDSYKAACQEFKEADKAVKEAHDGTIQRARWRLDNAAMMAKSLEPKEGLARLSIQEQNWVRSFFVIALCFSFATGVCAACAFYYSLQLRIGCTNGVAEVSPFLIVGTIFLFMHLQAGFVAVTED